MKIQQETTSRNTTTYYGHILFGIFFQTKRYNESMVLNYGNYYASNLENGGYTQFKISFLSSTKRVIQYHYAIHKLFSLITPKIRTTLFRKFEVKNLVI